MESKTVFAKLVAEYKDVGNYTTYVFETLDEKSKMDIDGNYAMCTRYPNWDHYDLKIGEKGYLHFNEVIAGKDTWFDGNSQIPYKYSAWQFIKFVPIQKMKEDLVLD